MYIMRKIWNSICLDKARVVEACAHDVPTDGFDLWPGKHCRLEQTTWLVMTTATPNYIQQLHYKNELTNMKGKKNTWVLNHACLFGEEFKAYYQVQEV